MQSDPGRTCAVRIFGDDGAGNVDYPLSHREHGEYATFIHGVRPGALYKFVVDGQELPDPYARYLPRGVHGPARVMEETFNWKNGHGVFRPLREQVIYELHVGTFSDEGTFESARARLSELAELGVTAVELMPVSAFPGRWGWGYDGVAHFAPFAGYGTPDQLRALIDDAHGLGLSVILDVVYNHFGPSGNYLRSYSQAYFSSETQNAWGDAPNYAHQAMRRYVLSNALYWLTEFRFDGLRLDATHAVLDPSPMHILDELTTLVHGLSPGKLLLAEDERNQPELVTETGLDGIWADDFHHVVHVTLTGERDGYYGAYPNGAAAIAETINRGWLFQGQAYGKTGKPRGAPADDLAAESFVYCTQNHDQIGNRAAGERLSRLVSLDEYCAASLLLFFLPMTPLIFMGQEWAASSPFQFFTDHDAELGRLICAGRRKEFQSFAAFADPEQLAHIPDPQAPATFACSRLRWDERAADPHRRVLDLYRRSIAFRRTDPVMRSTGRGELEASAIGEILVVRRSAAVGQRMLLANFGDQAVRLASLPGVTGAYRILLASAEQPNPGPSLQPGHALVMG